MTEQQHQAIIELASIAEEFASDLEGLPGIGQTLNRIETLRDVALAGSRFPGDLPLKCSQNGSGEGAERLNAHNGQHGGQKVE